MPNGGGDKKKQGRVTLGPRDTDVLKGPDPIVWLWWGI